MLLRVRRVGLADAPGGRVLALRQPVDTVVHDDQGDIRIPPADMDEILDADGQGITVSR